MGKQPQRGLPCQLTLPTYLRYMSWLTYAAAPSAALTSEWGNSEDLGIGGGYPHDDNSRRWTKTTGSRGMRPLCLFVYMLSLFLPLLGENISATTGLLWTTAGKKAATMLHWQLIVT